jgi:Di-haem cytochrome c peroxidase
MLELRRSGWLLAASVFLLSACSSGGEQGSQSAAANPCNPCAANVSNPCAAKNPCAARNPCAAQNPCNPCAAAMGKIDGSKIRQGDNKLSSGGYSKAELVAMGEKLWNDKSLSKAGTTSCSTCHVNKYAMMNKTFADPYPHTVAMAKERAGLDKVNAAEMVQLCMVIPMQNEPLDWNSVELAALSEYVTSIQSGYAGMNPCMGMNPCNPCKGMNPCNPCKGKGGN